MGINISIGNLISKGKVGKTLPFDSSLVDYWSFAGRSNNDANRDIITGVKGNILNAYNFIWELGSGYGKYTMNYLNYLNNSKSPEDIIITDSSITRLKGEGKISFWVTGNKLPTGITVIPSYRINVTGEWETPPEFTYYDGDNASISHTITLTHGINIIPEITINVITSISSTIYGFSTFQNGDVTIEQIPEYEGAIVTDGVDDYLKLDKVGYKVGTIIIKFKPINIKPNIVNSILNIHTDEVALQYDTSGVISSNFTAYKNYEEYSVGTFNIDKNAVTPLTLGCKLSNSGRPMEYSNIAIYDIAIYSKVLTNEQILSEIELMKQLK